MSWFYMFAVSFVLTMAFVFGLTMSENVANRDQMNRPQNEYRDQQMAYRRAALRRVVFTPSPSDTACSFTSQTMIGACPITTRIILKITMDGRVIISPDSNMDEATKAFWDYVKKTCPVGYRVEGP